MPGAKKILKKTGKVLLWILLGLLVLVLIGFIFINTNAGKRAVRNQIQKYLRNTLKTRVDIGSIDYSLPKWVDLKDVYFEDQKKDTLIYGQELRVDLDMIALLRGNTDIKRILFKNISINISRPEKDSVYNYTFLVDAFTGNKSTTVNTDTAEMKLSLKHLIFDHVALNFRDSFGGNNFNASIQTLDATSYYFHPDRVNFGINDFTASGVKFYMTTYKEPPVTVREDPAADTAIKIKAPYQLYISADKLNLRDVDVLIDNKVTGLYYANKITHLSASKALFSISEARGTADSLLLDSSAIVFTTPKPVVVEVKDTAVSVDSLPWFFSANHMDVRHSQIKYNDNSKPAAGGLDMNHLDTKDVTASISGFRYSKDTTSALVSQFQFKDAGGFILDTTHVNFIFTDKIVSATDLYIKTPQSLIQNAFQLSYDSVAAITKYPQNSLVGAKLNNTVIAFNDLYMLSPALVRSFPRDQFANETVNLNTELRGTLQRLYLPYLQLSGLTGSKLSGSGTLYNLYDSRKFSYDLIINQSNIFKRDLLKFVPPESRAQLADFPDVFNLRGRITGNMNTLAANVVASAKGFSFTGQVGLKNIMDPAHLDYAFSVTKATFSKRMIQGFLPPEVLQQLSLPDQISASGKFSGDINNILTDLKLNSSYGPLTVKGYIKNIQDPQRANYDLYITTPGFNIGRLVKQDTVMGNIAGAFTAKGTGYNYQTMRANIKANIASLQYKKYNYRNALINADFENGIIKSRGNINDSSLVGDYDLTTNVRGKYPTVKGFIDVDTAQLKKLHFTDSVFNFSARMFVDAEDLQPRQLNASLFLDSIHMQKGTKFYAIDTSSLVARSAAGVDSIVLKAPFAEVYAGGAFDYDKIGASIGNYINSYYHIPGYKPSMQNIPDQQFAMKGVIRNSPLITGFVPGLNDYADINFSGSYASANTDSALNFHATIPELTYTTTHVGNGLIDINSRNAKINYDVRFDTLKTAGNILYATRVNGGAAKDSLSLNALTKDAANRNWFGIAGSAFVNNDTYTFRMQDTLLLNYERWKVAPGNYIQYSPQGLIVDKFVISSDTARIAIQSKQLTPQSPIDIHVNNFNLKSISSIVNHDTIFLAGILNMDATVSDLNKTLPAFTGTGTVRNLEYMQYPLGDLSLNAARQSENNISAGLALLGAGNGLTVKGNYYLNDPNREFDADMQVKKLSLRILEAFSGGQIVNTGGNISGNVLLNGKFSDPHWKGELYFDTAKFALAQVGTPYFIDKQKIILDYPNIRFPQFTLTDSLSHPLKIDGNITSRSMMDYDLDLKINAKDFAIVNSSETLSSEAYGYASVNANVTVTGTSASPDIEGSISVNDKSDVHIVLPESSYEKNDGNTIVRFIDRDTFNVNPPMTGFEPARKPASEFAQFLNYNLNIEVTKGAALTILLDPATGDEIKVQGDARLNAGVDPGGHLVLAGVYELDKGYYDLHYQFLERKFNLMKGSTITFAGEPLQADANITAEYIANTNSRNLLDNEITDVTPNLANSFNQSLPFRVILYITGRLSKPNINFDIQMPEQNNLLNNDLRTTIENKLQQIRTDPAEINKQVFSLLLFNRFVSEQSSDFFKGNGSDFNDLARQSVSQFLSSALNEIASDLFKGVDIDLNLNSYNDYSNGGNNQRTDLNVAISKSFANDRVTVTVGQNFGIQGQNSAEKAAGTSSNSGFKPDVAVSYKLTADGKYMIRAYTKNQYEVVVEGYVVENGVAFLMTMEYNKFRELFRKKKKTPVK